jgi:hypothetical protein
MTIRKLTRLLAAIALASPLLVVSAPSQALVVNEFNSVYDTFAGDGCGSTSQLSLAYPARAWNVSIRRPLTGATFNDARTQNPVAQLTAAQIDRATHHARWTATGVEDVCSQPGLYADSGWETNEVYLRVDFTEFVHTYFASRCDNGRYRPRTIIVACGDGNFYFTHMSWHGWNTKVAHGRGRVNENDCIPACYVGHFHVYPIRVRLSRPRPCDDGHWDYTRLSWRYPGQRRPGDRNGRESWNWACHPTV